MRTETTQRLTERRNISKKKGRAMKKRRRCFNLEAKRFKNTS